MRIHRPLRPQEWGQVEIVWAPPYDGLEQEGMVRFRDGRVAYITRVNVPRIVPLRENGIPHFTATYRFRGTEYDTLDDAITAAYRAKPRITYGHGANVKPWRVRKSRP